MAQPSPSAPVHRPLPIGIQSFRSLRGDGHYYVDKTHYIERLIREGRRYFLSRPRRFGKSLLVDTIAELFEGSEELFRDLAIHDRWNWSVRRPVFRLDFAGGDFSSTDNLRRVVLSRLADASEQAGLPVSHDVASERLAALLKRLQEKTGRRVVVLVDEYDKPILDNLGSPDIARSNRDFLSSLYGTFKACDAHIRFLMLTGVSKFSKVNLFSGLNNLKDITLDSRFATICGYTQSELDSVFAPELEGLDREKIQEWYNGYRWLGEPVYNPFDVLLLLDTRKYRPHWFETGTPTFLIRMLARRGVNTFGLDHMKADETLLSAFDVEHIAPEALLFQTGYLTILDTEERGGDEIFCLGYPNLEVRRSLNRYLFAHLAGQPSAIGAMVWHPVLDAFHAGDAEGIEAELRKVLSSIPYQWHTRNDIARYEGFYASLLYCFLAGTGLEIRAEESSAAGRQDMAVVLEDAAWLFEFKIDERASPGGALDQLRARGYADKYRRPGRKVHLVGIHFSTESRNVVAFETAEA